MRVLIALLLTAAPALAQDPEGPPFDATLLDACLSRVQEQAAATEMPDYTSCVGAASGPCMDTPDGYTTVGTSSCLGQEYDIWDGKLNESYGRVLAAAQSTDAEMADLGSAAEKQVPVLKQMQRNWITFRDSACDYERSRWGGGTGGGPASVNCMVQLTAQQYQRLRAYEPRSEE